MKIRPHDFRVPPGERVHLAKWPTIVKPVYDSKKEYEALLAKQVEDLSSLYASNRYAVLMIFQAMDAAGKDGAIRHVMSGVNPQGCQVFSFKHPSATELEHDFLWRTTRSLPERGRIGVFDRCYYEEVGRPLVRRAGRRQGERARLIVSEIPLDVFDKLKMSYPKSTAKCRRELQSIRRRLIGEA